MKPGELVFSVHAIRRMAERDISVPDVRSVLDSGEIIESYPDDQPHRSMLVLGRVNGRPLHVVAAEESDGARIYIVTVYEPDEAQWDSMFRRRVKR